MLKNEFLTKKLNKKHTTKEKKDNMGMKQEPKEKFILNLQKLRFCQKDDHDYINKPPS